MSGVISGISIQSQVWSGTCATAVTSAWHCGQQSVQTSRHRVGLGCSGRYAPAWGLLFGFGSVSPFAFIACEGGLLELRGVFRGKLGLSRSAAFSVLSSSTSASKALTRASSAAIKASFSDGERKERSAGGVIVRLTHTLPHDAAQIHTPGSLAITRHVGSGHQPAGHPRG